jgi:hypothetical protein
VNAITAYSDREPVEQSMKFVLAGFGLTRGQVAAQLVGRSAPSVVRLNQELRRMTARAMRKGHYGRRGIPRYAVETMYRDYLDLGSLSKTARIYGRTRQSMWQIFTNHGLELNSRNLHGRIVHRGRSFTPSGRGGYYRETGGGRRPLHHVLWEDRTGRKIPAGWQVTFANGNNTDFRQCNLVCLPIHEVTLLHYKRRFRARASMTSEQRDQFWRDHNRDYMRRKAADFKARGLRSDGKRFRRP